MAPSTQLSRRTILRAAGTGLAAVGLSGLAAGSESVRVNVGYTAPSGKQAAVSVADDLVHEFAFGAVTVLVSASDAQELAARSDIDYVEADRQMEAISPLDSDLETTTSEPGDGYLAQTLPYGIDRVDAEVAHANGETGSGATVAIIDTGIDLTHPDLQGNVVTGVTTIGGQFYYDAAGAPPGGQDDNGHGTHCAGIAGAADNSQGVVGVSTAATLYPVKALTAAGVGFTSDIAKGLEHVADEGLDVASMSLGGPESETLGKAVTYASDAGVLLVAAAGNSGPCSDCVGYPAAYSEVIAVSATDSNDDLAEFSSTGPEVDLAAPGASIYSSFLGGTYVSLSGTSMACPHVAGAGAQLVANGYSASDARSQLQQTAEDIGLSSNEQGYGLLDVAAALGYDSSDDLDGGSDGGSSGGGTSPTATIESVSETESNSPHAEFDVTWSAHDDDGDLSSVKLTLVDETDGGTETSTTVDVSGTDASETTTLKAHKDDGSGHSYTVSLRARDGANNVGTDDTSVTENGS